MAGCIFKYTKLHARGLEVLPFIDNYRACYARFCNKVRNTARQYTLTELISKWWSIVSFGQFLFVFVPQSGDANYQGVYQPSSSSSASASSASSETTSLKTSVDAANPFGSYQQSV
jgi:hypothetical protein